LLEPEFHAKSKHLDAKYHWIREKVDQKVLDTRRVNTKDNLADVLTKPLPRVAFEDFVARLGMGGVLASGGVGSTSGGVEAPSEVLDSGGKLKE
jgi:hypothetical protein